MGKSLYILCFRKLAIRPLFVSQQMAVAALANLCECLNFFKLFYLFYLIIIFFFFQCFTRFIILVAVRKKICSDLWLR